MECKKLDLYFQKATRYKVYTYKNKRMFKNDLILFIFINVIRI